MVFGLGKKKHEAELIKEAVSGMPRPMETEETGLPQEVENLEEQTEEIEIPEARAMTQVELKPEMMKLPESVRLAPLFIKIDRYKEVLEKLNGLKLTLNNLDMIIKLKRDVEKVKIESDKLFEEAVEKFGHTVMEFDREFKKPEAIEPFIKKAQDQQVDEYVNQLQSELDKLEEHLKSIS